MGMQVRIDVDYDGIVDLLNSSGVADDLRRRAEQVADAARSRAPMVDGTPGDVPLPIEVVDASTERARFLVVADHAAGLAVEAKHRLLVGSLDAAR
jgi:hypothetical protein